jgi:hypothetical protein
MNITQGFRQLALCILLPLTVCAQANKEYVLQESTVPADVSQALRERVNLFFSYHIGSFNRKAIDLVAEDTKDYYYASGKVMFQKVNITGISFTKDLKKAAVQLETTQNWQVAGYTTIATTPVVTTWEIEDGKWVWYLDKQASMRSVTPMGESALPPPPGEKLAAVPMVNPDGTLNIPADFAEPARVAAQGMAILSQAALDRNEVTFTANKADQSEVKFHNGLNGQVSLKLYEVPDIPGLKISLSKSDLGPNEDAQIRFAYEPVPKGFPDSLLRSYSLRVTVIPLNQEYPIKFTMLQARQ